MVSIQLEDTHTNVLIAAAIAHYNGGYFEQNVPPGWITVEAEDRLRIEREMIRLALGRDCSDATWRALSQRVQGKVAEASNDVVHIEAHDP